MNRAELPIATPCDADWRTMTVAGARARMCVECNKVVHDLSSMTEEEVRATVGGGPVCVRYLFDVHGRVLLGTTRAPAGARVVPASALLSKAARSRWLAAAALAATAVVFEACGGHDGGRGATSDYDKPDAAPGGSSGEGTERNAPMPTVGDAGDAGDAADGSDGGDEPDAGD